MKKTMLTLCLAILLCCGVVNAQKMIKYGGRPKVAEGKQKIEGDKKIGGVQTITIEFNMLKDIDDIRVNFRLYGGVVFLGGDKQINYKKAKRGEIIKHKISFRVDKVPAGIEASIRGGAGSPAELEGRFGVQYDTLDEDGNLMSYPQYYARHNQRNYNLIEYRYDPDEPLPLDGQHIEPGQITDEKAKATRTAIEDLRKTKGPISDYEAIELLHNRIELFIRSGVEGQKAIDILWDARETTKKKGGDYWKNVDSLVKMREIKFFRCEGLGNSVDSFGNIFDYC